MGERFLGLFPRRPFRRDRRIVLGAAAGVLVLSTLPGCDSESENPLHRVMQTFANEQRDLFWKAYQKLNPKAVHERMMTIHVPVSGADSRLEIKQDIVQSGTTTAPGNTNAISFIIEKIQPDGKKSVTNHTFAKDSNGHDWNFSASKFIDGKEVNEPGYPSYTSSNERDPRVAVNGRNLITDKTFFTMAANTIAGDMTLFLQATSFRGATAQGASSN